jgi:hypothetical protein
MALKAKERSSFSHLREIFHVTIAEHEDNPNTQSKVETNRDGKHQRAAESPFVLNGRSR